MFIKIFNVKNIKYLSYMKINEKRVTNLFLIQLLSISYMFLYKF